MSDSDQADPISALGELEQLVRHLGDELAGFRKRALHAEADEEAAVLSYLERYLAAGASKKEFLAALSRTGLGPQVATTFKKRMKAIRESLAAVLKRAQKAGAIRKDVSADEVIALLHGVSAAMAGYAGPPEGRARILEVVIDGLRARSSK